MLKRIKKDGKTTEVRNNKKRVQLFVFVIGSVFLTLSLTASLSCTKREGETKQTSTQIEGEGEEQSSADKTQQQESAEEERTISFGIETAERVVETAELTESLESNLRTSETLTNQMITGRIITGRIITGRSPKISSEEEHSLTENVSSMFAPSFPQFPTFPRCPTFYEFEYQKCMTNQTSEKTETICWSENGNGDVVIAGSEECPSSSPSSCTRSILRFLEDDPTKAVLWYCKTEGEEMNMLLRNCQNSTADMPQIAIVDDYTGRITFDIKIISGSTIAVVKKTCDIGLIQSSYPSWLTYVIGERKEGIFALSVSQDSFRVFSVSTTSMVGSLRVCEKGNCIFAKLVCEESNCSSKHIETTPDGVGICINEGLGGKHYSFLCTPISGCAVSESERWCAFADGSTINVSGGVKCSQGECEESAFVMVKGNRGKGKACSKTKERCIYFNLQNCTDYQDSPTLNFIDGDKDGEPEKVKVAFGKVGKECELSRAGTEEGCMVTPQGGVACKEKREDGTVVLSFRKCDAPERIAAVGQEDITSEGTEEMSQGTTCISDYLEIRQDGTGSAQHCNQEGCITASLQCSSIAEEIPQGVKPVDENGDGVPDKLLVSVKIKGLDFRKSCSIKRVFADESLECDAEGKCRYEKEIKDKNGNTIIKRVCEGNMSDYICYEEKPDGEKVGCEIHKQIAGGENKEDFKGVKKTRFGYSKAEGTLTYETSAEKIRNTLKSAELEVQECGSNSSLEIDISAGTCELNCQDEIRKFKMMMVREWESSTTKVVSIRNDFDLDNEYEAEITMLLYESGSVEINGVRSDEEKNLKIVFRTEVSEDGTTQSTFEVFDSNGDKIAEGKITRWKGGRVEGEIQEGDKTYTISTTDTGEIKVCEKNTDNCKVIQKRR